LSAAFDTRYAAANPAHGIALVIAIDPMILLTLYTNASLDLRSSGSSVCVTCHTAITFVWKMERKFSRVSRSNDGSAVASGVPIAMPALFTSTSMCVTGGPNGASAIL
jgi:hypothetical protein